MKTNLAVLCLLLGSAFAQTYTFSTFPKPGTGAVGALSIHDNVIYGFATGGTHNDGLMYSMTTAGKITTLYNFGATSTDGKNPVGEPNYQSGNWYGFTTGGGKPGHGTIFKLTSKNKESTIWAWPSASEAELTLQPSMVTDSAGNLYGYNDFNHGGEEGNPFQVTQTGAIDELYDCVILPSGGPIIKGSTLYGDGYYSIFSFTTENNECNILHTFDGSDGTYPTGKLIQNAAGTLFGTTNYGGANDGGTVFSLTSEGVFSTLYNFCALSDCADGTGPMGPVVADTSGNLYGLNSDGVFKVTPGGVESLIYASKYYLGYE
jgi:uncharacterized repeat protein (TIGR03803 family)